MNKIYKLITKARLLNLKREIRYFQGKVLEYTDIITNPPQVLSNRMKNAVTIQNEYSRRLNQLSKKKNVLEGMLENAN